jgi:hypothetical protein
MVTDEAIGAIIGAMPEQMTNEEVASVLATIASVFSNEKDAEAVMHLNTAASMVLAKMIHQDRTFN